MNGLLFRCPTCDGWTDVDTDHECRPRPARPACSDCGSTATLTSGRCTPCLAATHRVRTERADALRYRDGEM